MKIGMVLKKVRLRFMNKFEVTRKLSEELNLPGLHINFGSNEIDLSEEKYQEFKSSFAAMMDKTVGDLDNNQ